MGDRSELVLMPRLKAKALQQTHSPENKSFYHLPHGVTGKCCSGTACFVARHLDPARWQKAVADDARVYCLGKCYVSPAAASDESAPRMVVHSRVPVVLERLVNGGAQNIKDYVRLGGYRVLEQARRLPPGQIIDSVERSELRGRGGAAFLTGTKWRMAAAHPTGPKFVVANADEGDPGAYIDRFILENDPHCFIEGMALAGHAVGAAKGWIYLRAEYPQAASILRHALNEALQAGVLNRHDGSPFSIEMILGSGSYICGEETALINSIEGKRPVAMARPPYATEQGLFGKPTIINNVETLSVIPWIVRHGAEAYRSLGFSKSRGTKVISLNSLFNQPGLYEVEFGISVRDIVEDLGGGLKTGPIKGLMIGGPLAGVIPPGLFDARFGFEELRKIGAGVGHGGVVAFDERTGIAELIHHVFSFGAYESCGKCIPCRLGSAKIEKIFSTILADGVGYSSHRREWNELVEALKLTSLCGLGIGLAEFAESISRYYGKELTSCLG